MVHVVDISHPNFLEQMETVKTTLAELNSGDKPLITVFNKIDAFKGNSDNDNGQMNLADFKKWWIDSEHSPCVFVSVLKDKHMDELKDLLYDNIKNRHLQIYPHQMLY